MGPCSVLITDAAALEPDGLWRLSEWAMVRGMSVSSGLVCLGVKSRKSMRCLQWQNHPELTDHSNKFILVFVVGSI